MVSPVAPQGNRGEEIAEILSSEVGFTLATDEKPVVATYGCKSCVALGGYEAKNRFAFVVHLMSAEQLTKSGDLILYKISQIAKEKIETPIQLHLRGGTADESQPVIQAIHHWMQIRKKDLPMEIASQDILVKASDVGSKSLAIDARTGAVSDYDPKTNPQSRGITDRDQLRALSNFYSGNIIVAYSPKSL